VEKVYEWKNSCRQAKMTRSEQKKQQLTWEAAIPLVSSPFFLWDMLKLFGITALVMGLLLALIQLLSPAPGFWQACWLIPLLVSGGLFLLSLLVSILVFFNRYWARFTLDGDGVLYESARGSRTVSRALGSGAIILGLLRSAPVAAGAGMLARSRNMVFLSWCNVCKISPFPRYRVITLSNCWRPVLRLHCPSQLLYDQAIARLEAAAPKARWKAHPAVKARKRNVDQKNRFSKENP